MTDTEHPLHIATEPVDGADALALLEELSQELEAITGDGGRGSFDSRDMDDPRADFVVARDETGAAVGCGALRPLTADIAEIKRVYARTKGTGVGSAIVAELERRAVALGYAAVRLETRAVNAGAVRFYDRHGYRRIENFGKYAGRADAVCFEKRLQA